MPRLTDVQYVCDYCQQPFSEPSEAVIGRLSVWKGSDDPREAVRGKCGGSEGLVAGARGAKSGRGRGRKPDSTRSRINVAGQPDDNNPNVLSWSFPLPASTDTVEVALHPECADKLTYGAWLSPPASE